MLKINLLDEKKKKGKIRQQASSFILPIAFAVATFMLMGIAAFYLTSEVSQLESHVESNKEVLFNLAKEIDEVKKYERLNKEIRQRSSLIENLRRKQVDPVRMLDNVSAVIPRGVWLSSLTYNGGTATLQGYAFTNINIVRYVKNLKELEMFTGVFLEESRQVEVHDVKVYRFKLNFRVRT